MYIRVHIRYPLLFLADHNETCIFSIDFKKIRRYQISEKIRPVEAKFFHADRHTPTDRQTDMMKLIVAFRNFSNVPKAHEEPTHP